MRADLEKGRLATLNSLKLLDTPSELEFDTIVELAQRLTGSKIALVSLVDRHRQWFKAKIGLNASETPREDSFCDHVVATDDVLVVPDAWLDNRFSGNALVTGSPNIRFYAGVPIRAAMLGSANKRVPLGALCVIDTEPRAADNDEIELLIRLAKLVEALITARSSAASALSLAAERGSNLQKLDRKHRQLRQAERMANIGSWRLTLVDRQTEWSEQTYAIHGVPVGDGTPLDAALDFYPPRARVTITDALDRTVKTGEPFDVETDFITAQGEYRRVRSMGELETDKGKATALIGVFQDITSRFMMEQALRLAAYTDELTGIANRGRFIEFVDESIGNCAATGERCVLLLIDLDHFKAVNDRLGHHAGDEVLQVMASRLQAAYLANCFAARLGGDEFVLVITDEMLLRDLSGLLRRLLGDLRHVVHGDGLTLPVSATIGAAWLNDQAASRSELLSTADAALYQAKRRQRGSAMIAEQAELIVLDEQQLPELRLLPS